MRIPTDITPLEYIAGSGSQYIETAIHLLSTDVVKSKWRFQNSAGNVYGCFTSSSAEDNFCLYAGNASTNAYIRYNGQLVRDFKATSGTVYEIEQGPDGFFVGGSKVADFDAATFTCSAPMYIFMLPNSSSAKVTARCYGLQVIRGGEMAYDFIPARNEATGEVGLWEAVHGAWYGNDGTGAFTAGNVAERVLGTTHDGWRRRLMMAASKHYEIVPGSDGYNWCYFDVTDTTSPTKILNATNGVDTTMIVDGVPTARATSYTFQTTGIHLVKFKINIVSQIAQFWAYCDRLVECYLAVNFLTYFMFKGCTNLRIVGTDNVTGVRGEGGQFGDCALLANLNFKSFLSGSLGNNMTNGCTSLDKVEFPVAESISSSGTAFNLCQRVIIGPNCVSLSGRIWQRNKALREFVCKAVVPPAYSGYVLSGTDSSMSIYVPDESVDAYKAASGWSGFSSQIKPLSEYIDN